MIETNYAELMDRRDDLLSQIMARMKNSKKESKDPWGDMVNSMFPPLIDFMSQLLDVISKNEKALLEAEKKLQVLAAAAVPTTPGATN